MSADNTVVVLITQGDASPEYRVRHIQVKENLTEEPNYPTGNPVLNREYLLRLFGDAPTIVDSVEAYREAVKLADSTLVLEYGIEVIDCRDVDFPTG
ncbi:MAG: hypothetical protein ABSE91_04045 [Patescibacteria group bacterium]|jgi:hypothetical protein